jgi:hypothetical protein
MRAECMSLDIFNSFQERRYKPFEIAEYFVCEKISYTPTNKTNPSYLIIKGITMAINPKKTTAKIKRLYLVL